MTTRVFISYAKEDKDVAKKLYTDLQQGGVWPWLDSEDLLPGQVWKTAIRKAIDNSNYVIALLSSRSVGKKGYVQWEIRYALEIAETLPDDKIFIIPMRIDECEPSFEGLRRLHRVDIFTSYEKALEDLLRSFNYQSEEKPTLVKVDIRRHAGPIVKLTDKGFGFIDIDLVEAGTRRHLFFHAKELKGVTYEELRAGDLLIFSIAQGSKGQAAVDVERA